jgi:hypothetical protein
VWGNLLKFPLLAMFLTKGEKDVASRIRGLKKDEEFKNLGCL